MKLTGFAASTLAGTGHGGLCAIQLRCSAGHAGIALGSAGAAAAAARLFTAVLRGQDPRPVSGLWERMSARGGSQPAARALLDLALWDLRARINDEPLWKTLGGMRPGANAHVAGAAPAGDATLARWIAAMTRSHGFRGACVTLGNDLARNRRRLHIVHEALTRVAPDPALMVRMPVAATPATTLRQLRQLERTHDLTWVEYAARATDFRGLRRVSDGVAAAACAGAKLHSLRQFRACLRARAADIIQLDISRLGITAALQVADAAFGHELPVVLCAVPGNVHAHVAAVVPSLMSVEITNPARNHGPITTDIHLEHGRAVGGDTPGNGITIAGRRRG